MKDYINNELAMLDRSIVATPKTRQDLQSFAEANQGSSDLLLMQMAMNYGYKLALENLEVELQTRTNWILK
jgi:hypothetical protein|tara:strand:+ start:184 stop:396 length:213 start_codon:yes stop_codon:yes gene_type:complete